MLIRQSPGRRQGSQAVRADDIESMTTMMTRISSSIPRRRPPARLRRSMRFVRPFLKNYRKMLAFVSFGVVVETLFNVIMPLSLKFLIDDALGEEDFQALYMILGVLAAAGTSPRSSRSGMSVGTPGCGLPDCRCALAAVRPRAGPAVGLFRADPARRNPVAVLHRPFGLGNSIKSFANSAACRSWN